MKTAAFLDRDGTINHDPGFVRDPADVVLLPGAGEAVRRLNEAGLFVVVVTNQSGIARGFFDEATLTSIHDRLRALLAEHAARVDAIYHCPHLPDAPLPAYDRICDCRKPAPGLLRRAAAEHGLDLHASFTCGDKERDVEAGLRAGCARSYLIADPPRPTLGCACHPSLLACVTAALASRSDPAG